MNDYIICIYVCLKVIVVGVLSACVLSVILTEMKI